MNPLILGSQSPRRKEILEYFALPFEVYASDFDESSIPFEGDPDLYVKTLSACKAEAVGAIHKDRIILTADTIVYREGKVYGKPRNEEEAVSMLEELSGTWHSVYTGVSVLYNEKLISRSEETKVLFNQLSQEQISKYHEKLHLYDKAGSYQLQMAGGIAVSRIDGCYYNVIGLPINTVKDLLHEALGIDLWDYLR